MSPELQAAQKRLYDLREKNKPQERVNGSHWMAALRERLTQTCEETPPEPKVIVTPPAPIPPAPVALPPTTIKILPDLAMSILKAELASVARIWWLLRSIDHFGRGVVEIAVAKKLLAKKGSTLRACGWRQLRNLLRQGEGIFWTRDKERIWLRSTAKVGHQLEVDYFSIAPVMLNVTDLLGTMGDVKAHLYATFHAEGRLIARGTLQTVSGLSYETQRSYEKRVGIRPIPQYAIQQGNHMEEAAWKHGCGTFKLIDKRGQHGRAGNICTAWQLPNLYRGVNHSLPKCAYKKLNRKLTDLLNTGTMGNSRERYQRHFCRHGAEASRQDHESFYPSDSKNVWYVMA